MKKLAGGFLVGVFITLLACYTYFHRVLAQVYDTTLQAHLSESIMNADQIRNDDANAVLNRIDAWLKGDQIEESVRAWVFNKDVEDRMLVSLGDYRRRAADKEGDG